MTHPPPTSRDRSESPQLNALAERIDSAIAASLAARPLGSALDDALAYAPLGAGKRLRPALVLLSARACGAAEEIALPAAVAIELVHCFSLVHDDLPAMDDDDLRRGRPTLHIRSGEATALLAGDALLVRAFGVLAAAPLPGDVTARLCHELAEATTHMIEGQMLDTVGGVPAHLPPAEQLRLIHGGKTGALIRAACRMGGIAAGAGEEAIAALDRYGRAVGMLFQVVDDLIDETQTSDHVGKRTGKDRDRGRLTWPGALGLEETRRVIASLLEQAQSAAFELRAASASEDPDQDSAGKAASDLSALARDMASRTR